MTHERRIQLLALAAGAPAVTTVLLILWWQGDYTPKVQWTLTALAVGTWLGCAAAVRERVASPLRTLANLMEAMREGDYSIRARQAQEDDALGDVMQQVNQMSTTLRAQRLGALEATTLLRKVMAEIDVALFAFDPEQKLKLINPAGERVLGQPAERIMNLTATALGLADCLGEETVAPEIVQKSFPAGTGRWALHRGLYREGGVPHQLLVLSDLTKTLREEELQAWQRIVRVLGHEMNNSLTPIKSIAGSLGLLLKREPLDEDWRQDTLQGLEVIATRSESLSRFLGSYARLAKLPKPVMAPIDVPALVRRTIALETRLPCTMIEGPGVTVRGDSDQLEQVLINLVKNAVDASLEAGWKSHEKLVEVGWAVQTPLGGAPQLEIWIGDRGPGLASTANLFVPFFTTKPGGSGIGLVLARQIVEGHGGSLTLENREPGPGCEARVILPFS
ncbi:MAG: PAS domain-containing sensor histidine kinase [Bryobacteraceae bacterium]|nr:PAS domain-containing sensor histidine kinase [Bryobacteraceae bacterium]